MFGVNGREKVPMCWSEIEVNKISAQRMRWENCFEKCDYSIDSQEISLA